MSRKAIKFCTMVVSPLPPSKVAQAVPAHDAYFGAQVQNYVFKVNHAI